MRLNNSVERERAPHELCRQTPAAGVATGVEPRAGYVVWAEKRAALEFRARRREARYLRPDLGPATPWADGVARAHKQGRLPIFDWPDNFGRLWHATPSRGRRTIRRRHLSRHG